MCGDVPELDSLVWASAAEYVPVSAKCPCVVAVFCECGLAGLCWCHCACGGRGAGKPGVVGFSSLWVAPRSSSELLYCVAARCVCLAPWTSTRKWNQWDMNNFRGLETTFSWSSLLRFNGELSLHKWAFAKIVFKHKLPNTINLSVYKYKQKLTSKNTQWKHRSEASGSNELSTKLSFWWVWESLTLKSSKLTIRSL